MNILRHTRYYYAIPLTLFFLIYFQWKHIISSTFPNQDDSSQPEDLDINKNFQQDFQVYVLTHACNHITAQIASYFESFILVPDVDSADCQKINQPRLPFRTQLSDHKAFYNSKYASVLQHYASHEKNKCLVLEEVVFSNTLENRHTVTIEEMSDCTKMGLYKTPYPWSKCDIYSQQASTCMNQCIQANDATRYPFFNDQLKKCQSQCNRDRKHFLINQAF